MFENAGSDDDTGKTDDHGSSTHGNIKVTLLLGKYTAAQRYQTICNSKTDDLYHALVNT